MSPNGYINDASFLGPFYRDFCGYMWLWNNNQAVLTPWATLDTFPSSTPGLAQQQFKDVLVLKPSSWYIGQVLYTNLACGYEHWLVRRLPCTCRKCLEL